MIVFSMLRGRTQDSHPYNSTDTQVTLKSLILLAIVTVLLLQIFYSFQNAIQTRAFRCNRSLRLEATMDPRYLKFVTCFIGWPYTSSAGCGLQLTVMYSVLLTLIIRPNCFPATAVLVSCICAFGMDDSSKAMSLTNSRSFKVLAGCLLDQLGWVTIPESDFSVVIFVH